MGKRKKVGGGEEERIVGEKEKGGRERRVGKGKRWDQRGGGLE